MSKLLHLSTNGILYYHTKNGLWAKLPVVAEWDCPTNETVQEVSGALKILPVANLTPNIIRCNAVSSQSKAFIFARMNGTVGSARGGIAGHIGDVDPINTADGVVLTLPFNHTSTAALWEWINGSVAATLDSLASQNAAESNMWLLLNGHDIDALDSDTSRAWAGTTGTLASGQLGLWGPQTNGQRVEVYSLFFSTDRYLTVAGLTSGDSVLLRDSAGTTLASGSESGGSAQIDMMGVAITDIADLVVVRSAVIHALCQYAPNPFAGGSTYTLNEDVEIAAGLSSTGTGGTTPRARRYSGTYDRTYFGGIDEFGHVTIAQYDESTGAITSTIIDTFALGDSHSCPAILVDSDGYIWAFWSKHDTEAGMYYRKSTNPEAITAWGAIETLGFDGNVTYPQVFQTSTGRIVVMCRTGGSSANWQSSYTDNGGTSWAAPHTWIASTWIYQTIRQHADLDTLTVLLGYHPTSAANHNVRLCKINLETGVITNPATGTIGNLYSGGGVTVTNALLVFSQDATHHGWADDVDEDGNIVLMVWDPADQANTGVYNYLNVAADGTVGTMYEIVAAGALPWNWGHQQILAAGSIILARENSGVFVVEQWTTEDGGANWSSGQLNADPDDDVIARIIPVVPVFHDPSDPYAFYNRTRSATNASYVQASDMVFVTAEPFTPPEPPTGGLLLNPDMRGGFTQRLRGGF